MINLLNLGAGVQSSTLLLMSCKGELPKMDRIIFADTGWEPKNVYRQLDWLKEQAAAHGMRIDVRTAGNIRSDAENAYMRKENYGNARWLSMPFFTGDAMIRRQCTSEYKIQVIERYCRREIMGLKPRQRAPKTPQIRQFLGISFDERGRCKTMWPKWTEYVYPLVEAGHTRTWCYQWLADNGYPEPPRSACIGCPYKHDSEWRALKNESPAEFEDACQFDEMIRKRGGMRGDLYLHRSCVPLREVDFSNDYDRGQLPLWDDECSGMCGV